MRVTSTDIISDDQGESLGSVAGYIDRFKKIDAGQEVRNVPEFTSIRDKITSLPSEWKKETETEILTHYYRRFGDRTCTDFQVVSDKLAQNINRLFKQTFSSEEIFKKLSDQITLEGLIAYDEKVQLPSSKKVDTPILQKPKVKLNLKETSYSFITNRPPLTLEYLDLAVFVDPSNLCFSSDGYSLFLSTKPGCEGCFDNLFNFSPREEMVFQMFKEQLGDEIKAKKLVLMSKMLNEDVVKENRCEHDVAGKDCFTCYPTKKNKKKIDKDIPIETTELF